MLIHATAIANLTDARYFAAKEVNYLGFSLEDGVETHLDPAHMHAIREWVQGPVLTGWFEQSTLAEIAEAARFYNLAAVVVHQNLVADADTSVLVGVEWHLRLPFEQASIDLTDFVHAPSSVILDVRGMDLTNFRDGSPEGKVLGEICRRRKIILYCDALSHDELNMLEAAAPLAGICLSGGAEEKVGVKAFDALEDLFDALEERRFV